MVAVMKKGQAISGVSAVAESEIMTVFPSIACTAFGQLMGRLFESIPLRIFGIKLSYLLFVPFGAPLGALGYMQLKLTGERYVLTNRAVQRFRSLGHAKITQVLLADIDQVVVRQSPGQTFFQAADLQLLNSKGDQVLLLSGVPRANIFRQTIIEARDARKQVAAALDTIRNRRE